MAKFYHLDNVFDTAGEEDFTENLDNYLEHMPRTRESALEILAETESYDCWDLYVTLFEDFSEFLTAEELKNAAEKYKNTFDQRILPITAHLDGKITESL